MQICIYEDTAYSNFLPLVYLRPVYELRCGIFSLREKIEQLFPKALIVLHTREILAPLLQEDYPRRTINRLQQVPTWFVNGRLLADKRLLSIVTSKRKDERVYRTSEDEVVAAFVLPRRLTKITAGIGKPLLSKMFEKLPVEPAEACVIKYPWELVKYNQPAMLNDLDAAQGILARSGRYNVEKGVHLLNKNDIICGGGCRINPGVVLDADQGPIVLGKNTQIMPNAVIQGPAFIGDDSIVKIGAKLYPGTSVGRMCKVGGEIDGSIIHSYANKQHDGFLGHSYLGSWVNLGADTNTSDLKNTYGKISVTLDGKSVNTGMQFLGLIMGDHSKTGINVMMNTGSIVGVSCNIYGADLPPKYLPSFSWGGGNQFEMYDIEKSLETAKRVMARRGVKLTEAYETVYRDIFRSLKRKK